MTPLGRWLRSLSLDDFPEPWRVLSGEMDLVGPATLMMRYLPRCTPAQARRQRFDRAERGPGR
jgi:lipopolysaccharide/colanic/teichoic acid biosynthesis glycosyltransferase